MSNKGNNYFETLNGIQGELTDEVLVNRMNECNMVLGNLAESPVWKIVLNDSRELIKKLDDNWQDMPPDTDKFREARIIKMACKHISDLPGKYLQELEQIQDELTKRQNPADIVQKDLDNN
jgi:hypothetical protein